MSPHETYQSAGSNFRRIEEKLVHIPQLQGHLAAATAAAGVELLPALPANPANQREKCKALAEICKDAFLAIPT
jgi:hypothetical protein